MPQHPYIMKTWYYAPKAQGKHSMYACGEHLRYMGNPKKEELVSDAEALRDVEDVDERVIHARYMAERPGSQGYFGPDPRHPPDAAALAEELRTHDGPVWRLFPSVHADDVAAMGGQLFHRAAWEQAARAVLPRMAEEMGIPPESLRWVAAMHRKDGHPHLHVLLWSADPTKGYLSTQSLDAAKRLWVSELYAPERIRLGQEKSELRKSLTEHSRLILGRVGAADLGQQLADIAGMLPGKGRLAYAYMPPDVKQRLDATADWLLAQPELRTLAQRYGDIAAELAKHYSLDPAKHDEARQTALTDIRQRLAGGILRHAVAYDDNLAWQSIQADLWRAARGQPGAGIAAEVRAAVSRLAAAPSRNAALSEARTLLAGPLAAETEALLARAARRGKPEGAGERVARTQARLEAVVAKRLERSAEYVRDARAWRARQAASGLMMALRTTIREAERDALRAAARAAEEDAARKRAAAQEAEQAI